MYPDSPESRDVPAHARTRGPSPVRASVAGGLVGGIGVMTVLILTGVVALPGAGRRASEAAVTDTAAATTDTTAIAAVVPTTDSVVTTMTTDTTMAAPAASPRALDPPPAESPEPPASTPEQRVRMYREALQEAILRADEAEIQAQRRLDASLLYDAYSGDQLQSALSSIESLRGQDVHMDSRLLDIQWHSFWVSPDERTARVETTETWYSEYHQNGSDECVAVAPEHNVPQRATLRREGGVWKVSSVTFTGTSPQLQECS
jgi:hypothetical protein